MRATATVLPGAPRLPADCFCRHQLGGYPSWDLSGGLAQPRSPTRAAATGKQRSNIFWAKSWPGWCSCGSGLGGEEGWKTRVCDDLDCFFGTADGLGRAKRLRRSRCDCSGGPTFRSGGFSPLKQPTTPHKFAWPRFGYVEHAMHRWTNSQIEFKSQKTSENTSFWNWRFRISFENAMLGWFTFWPIRYKLNWIKNKYFGIARKKNPR